jgi:integrase
LASIRIHRADGKIRHITQFEVRWSEPSGQHRSKTFRQMTEARRFKSLLEAELLTGSYRPPSKLPPVLFGDFARAVLERQGLSESYRASRSSYLEKHLVPVLGSIPVVALDRATLQRTVAGIRGRDGRPLGRATVSGICALLGMILQRAVDDGLIRETPAPRRWDLPHGRPDPRVFLADAECDRLIDAFDLYWQPLVIFLIDTGCRWGEAAGLPAGNVSLADRRVLISQALSEVGGALSIKATKSGRARFVDLPARAVEALQRHLETVGPNAEGFVFHGPRGGLLRRSAFAARIWEPAVTRAALPVHPVRHSLRHSHVSLMIAAGVDPVTGSKRVGHARPSIFTDTYAHQLPNADQDTLAKIAAFRVRKAPHSGHAPSTSPAS